MCHGACNQAIVDAMGGPTRPTAVVLFIHNGLPGHAHLKVLQLAAELPESFQAPRHGGANQQLLLRRDGN
jgi:hypothetical protein